MRIVSGRLLVGLFDWLITINKYLQSSCMGELFPPNKDLFLLKVVCFFCLPPFHFSNMEYIGCGNTEHRGLKA
jgi:hypothetical protein